MRRRNQNLNSTQFNRNPLKDDGNKYFDIFRYSHPCVNCAPILNKLNFQKIVYSTDECEFIPELKKFKMKELTVVKKVRV